MERIAVGYASAETPWGWVALAASPEGLCRLELPHESQAAARRDLLRSLPDARPADEASFAPLLALLRRYFAGERVEWDIPLDLSRGTAFQRRVWEALRVIPYGERRSYAQLAAAVGSPRASRAVGSALARNPVPIILPCHRVLRTSGALGGFGGGLEMKQRLLDLEASARVA